MNYLKAAIVTVISLIVILVCFMFYTFNASYGLEQVLDSVQKKKTSLAKSQLKILEKGLSPIEILLYTAYVERELKNFVISDKQLERAQELAQMRGDPLLLEITLNRVLNAYLQVDETALFQNISTLQELAPHHPWTTFFMGIEAYEKEQFQQALPFWSRSVPNNFLSEWMHLAFSSTFTSSWLDLKTLRCQIAMGQHLKSKERLSEWQKSASGEDLESILLLLTLCYFKEAEEKPEDIQHTYYRIAYSYFGQLSTHQTRLQKERKKIYQQMKDHAKVLIERKQLEHLVLYLSFLEREEAYQERKEVAQALMHIFRPSSYNNTQEMIAQINQCIPTGETRELLSKLFEDLFWQNIFLDTPHFYAMMSIFLSRNPKEKGLEFSQKLIAFAKERCKEDLTKSLILIKIAYDMPQEEDRGIIEKEVKKLLYSFYEHASHSPSQLFSILQQDRDYRFFQFEKDKDIFISKCLNCYNQNQILEAIEWAKLALIYDPAEQQAVRICGVSAFKMADYRFAQKILKRLLIPDHQVAEAIFISQLLTSSIEQRAEMLHHLSINNLSDEAKLQLAFGLLSLYESEKALEILQSIREPNNEVHAAIACAAFDTNRWNIALHHFYLALYPYSSIEGLQAIAMQSLLALGKNEAAQSLLPQGSLHPADEQYSCGFRHFKKTRLDPIAVNLSQVK